jgi:hypothetical protein
MAPYWPFYRNNRSTVIDIFNKDPTKNVYLVITYKKTWYFSESKTIDVHCRRANMSFPIFTDILGSMREKLKIL